MGIIGITGEDNEAKIAFAKELSNEFGHEVKDSREILSSLQDDAHFSLLEESAGNRHIILISSPSLDRALLPYVQEVYLLYSSDQSPLEYLASLEKMRIHPELVEIPFTFSSK